MEKEQEKHYKSAVMRAHNIEITDNGFMCNDGDCFKNIWEALDHTIWLDLMTKTIKDGEIKRDCNDYYEIINQRPSHQSMEENTARSPPRTKDAGFPSEVV